MARMPDFFDEVEQDAAAIGHGITGLFHHHAPDSAPQAPASRPDNQAAPAATTQENTVPSLAVIAGDIKTAIGNADQWVKEVTENHLPAILAQAQKYENSPIVQALETALLPPEVEAGIAATITALAKQYPAQPQPAAQPQPSFQPAQAPQQ